MLATLFFTLLCVFLPVFPFDLRGSIQFNDVCPGIEQLRPSKVLLDDGRMKGSITRNGSFAITDVPAGTYVLSVVSPHHSFDQLRVDVLDSANALEVRPYAPGTPLNPPSAILLSHPITLTPRQKHQYFVPPESFNLVAMFSNPMMLLMVFGGVMMLAMPYIMNNIDLEELKEQQSKVAGTQNAVADGDSNPMGINEFSTGKTLSSTKNRGSKSRKR